MKKNFKKYILMLAVAITYQLSAISLQAQPAIDSTKILNQTQVDLLTVTSDPSVSPGIQSTIGSVALAEDTGLLYSKIASAATSWQTYMALGSGANVFLSNLQSPTAINQDLIWGAGYLQLSAANPTNPLGVPINAAIFNPLADPSFTNSSLVMFTTQNDTTAQTGSLGFFTGNNVGGTGSEGSGGILLFSGNVDAGGTGTSGIIQLTTGGGPSTGDLDLVTGDVLDASGNPGGIQIESGKVTDGVGGDIDIETGQMNGNGNTGNLNFQTGGSNGASATGFTGSINMSTGTVFGVGSSGSVGNFLLTTGDINDPTSTTTGGTVQISSGTNSGTGNSGPIFVESGSSGGNSGAINILSGAVTSPGLAGNIILSTNNASDLNAYFGSSLALVSTSVGPNTPSIVFDGTTTAATTAGSVGILLNANQNQSELYIESVDQTAADTSAQVIVQTGYNTGSGDTGEIFLASGSATGSAGDTGPAILISGNSTNGNSGQVQIFSGSGNGTTGTSGNVSISTQAANTTGNISLETGSSPTTGPSGNISIATGSNTGSGNTGNIVLSTGIVTTGTSGTIELTSPYVTLSGILILPVQAPATTPTCTASQNGGIALTSAYIMCVCNGTSWVQTSDGTTACTF